MMTETGKMCARWNSDAVPTSAVLPPTTVPHFCRNPDDSKNPWVYNEDGDKQFCDIENCAEMADLDFTFDSASGFSEGICQKDT